MPRILIVSAGHLCRNPRIVKEAETLARAGHDVTVLTVRNHAASELADLALLRDAPYRRVAIDLLSPSPTGRLRRFQTWFARRRMHRLGWQSPHALGPAPALLSLARAHPADLTIVHTEAAFWVGTQLLRDGRKVAADFEDWHSEDLLPEDRTTRPLGLLRMLERDLLQHAAYTSTTSHALADALHARHGGPLPIVLTNSFPLQPDPRRAPLSSTGVPPVGLPSPALLPSSEAPTFFWFSQTLGPGRGLEFFFAAWSRTKNPSRVALLGGVQPAYREKLLARLPPERRALVSFLPLVPPAELPSVIARHDIGLALEQEHIVNRDLTITNKILQYLNAGLAVVASSTAGQREVLDRAPDAGILEPHETALFAAALDALLADPVALARHQAAARRAAGEIYSWEREAPALLAAVANALAPSASGGPVPPPAKTQPTIR